jgi:hypothetical protein
MRWAEHTARMRWNINAEKVLVSKLEGKSHLQDLGVDGRTVLKRILNKLISSRSPGMQIGRD